MQRGTEVPRDAERRARSWVIVEDGAGVGGVAKVEVVPVGVAIRMAASTDRAAVGALEEETVAGLQPRCDPDRSRFRGSSCPQAFNASSLSKN